MDDLFGTMFVAWMPGLGWGWGVTNILAMGVREAPGDPPADDFKATCSLQPAAHLEGSFPFLGVWGGHRRASAQTTSNSSAAALGGLAAFALVGDMGACLQSASKVYAVPGRWLKLEKEAQAQEWNPDLDRGAQI